MALSYQCHVVSTADDGAAHAVTEWHLYGWDALYCMFIYSPFIIKKILHVNINYQSTHSTPTHTNSVKILS